MKYSAMLAVVLLFAGCDSEPQGPVTRKIVRLGTLDRQPRIEVPQAARAGVPFRVEVTTHAEYCSAKGETVVTVNGLQARVLAYDTVFVTHARDGLLAPCPDGVQEWEHDASLVFNEPGMATVQFKGHPTFTSTDTVSFYYSLQVTN